MPHRRHRGQAFERPAPSAAERSEAGSTEGRRPLRHERALSSTALCTKGTALRPDLIDADKREYPAYYRMAMDSQVESGSYRRSGYTRSLRIHEDSGNPPLPVEIADAERNPLSVNTARTDVSVGNGRIRPPSLAAAGRSPKPAFLPAKAQGYRPSDTTTRTFRRPIQVPANPHRSAAFSPTERSDKKRSEPRPDTSARIRPRHPDRKKCRAALFCPFRTPANGRHGPRPEKRNVGRTLRADAPIPSRRIPSRHLRRRENILPSAGTNVSTGRHPFPVGRRRRPLVPPLVSPSHRTKTVLDTEPTVEAIRNRIPPQSLPNHPFPSTPKRPTAAP